MKNLQLAYRFQRASIHALLVASMLIFTLIGTPLEASNEAPKRFRSQLSGFSMYPTIKSGEHVIYRQAELADIAPGDIVVFVDRRTGRRVCHRVTEVVNGALRTKGDNNRFSDRGFLSEDYLLGVVTHINGQSV